MKIALITDTHFGVRNDSIIFHEYFKKSLKYFFEVIQDHKIEVVIHLGDLYHRRTHLNFLSAKLCREEFLEKLEERHIETHIILGNHDVFYRNTTKVNSLDELVTYRYKFINTVVEPERISLGSYSGMMIPWICEENKQEIFDFIKKHKDNILFGHLELSGFEMHKGIVQSHGLEKDLFKDFEYVFSGHYHHKSSKGNIHYLGAFTEQTWSDYDDPKGFHIFDTETKSLTFYPVPTTIFKMIKYDDSEKDIINTINNTDYSQYRDCYVKVVCSQRDNTYLFDTMIDKLYQAEPIDVSIIEDVSSFIDNEEDETVDESQDTPTILSKYIDGLTLPVDNVIMKDYIKEIYNEALTLETIE